MRVTYVHGPVTKEAMTAILVALGKQERSIIRITHLTDVIRWAVTTWDTDCVGQRDGIPDTPWDAGVVTWVMDRLREHGALEEKVYLRIGGNPPKRVPADNFSDTLRVRDLRQAAARMMLAGLLCPCWPDAPDRPDDHVMLGREMINHKALETRQARVRAENARGKRARKTTHMQESHDV